MLQSILVGLDGSVFSSTATRLGIEWAERCDALLVGMGIINEPAIRKPEAVPMGAGHFKQDRDDSLLVRERHRIDQILEQFALECAQAGVAYKLLEEVGTAYEQLLLQAQRYDLIFLGQQTHFNAEGLACDTLHQLLKVAPRPVVVVPEELPAGNKVTIAYDGGMPSVRALQAFQQLRLDDSKEIHIVSVGTERIATARCADRAVEFLRLHGVAALAHPIVSTSSQAHVILSHAAELGASLLVMGAYGHSSIREFFLGSVTRAVLKDSPMPVFLYH